MKGNPQLRRGRNYYQKRAMELATPAKRALTSPLAEWAVKKVRLEGRPFSFDGHEYLRAIYDDTAQHIVLSKAAQIGGTTWAILRSLFACIQGLNVIYFFPTKTDVLEFSKSRVGPMLGDNPFLAKMMSDTDTAGLKRIGDAHLYLRGMKSTVGMKSVPADMVVFDELDEATPDARAMAWERIAHSDYKRVIELSNPSLPGYGIDEQFMKSNQLHWTLKCPGCNHWTALERDFPDRLGQEITVIQQHPDGTWYRACPKCARELDLEQGEWVADFPDRSIHGYRVSQLFSPKMDPGEIVEEYTNCRFPERFYNLKIGIPWADLERRLDVQTVLALCRSGEAPNGYSVMGVDTGKRLHVVVLQTSMYNRRPAHVIHLEACSTFDDLDRIMKEYRINECVIDGLPETHATRDFARRYHGKVHLCFFNESQRGEAKWDNANLQVQINRTEALDASRAVVREAKVTIPPRSPLVEEFARHMSCDAKVLDEDPDTGAQKYRYVKTGENHYSFAFTYAVMAMERLHIPMSPEQRAEFERMIMPW